MDLNVREKSTNVLITASCLEFFFPHGATCVGTAFRLEDRMKLQHCRLLPTVGQVSTKICLKGFMSFSHENYLQPFCVLLPK